MKRFLSLILVIISIFSISSMAGCTDNTVYTPYELESALEHKLVGFGAQMDTDIFTWNNFLEGEKEMWLDRIRDMNLQYTRIKFYPEFFERENDNNDPNTFDINGSGINFNSIEMQALYTILDVCEETNIRVDLSWYGAYNFFNSADGLYTDSWLAIDMEETVDDWVTAPYDYYEYAENIYVLLDYLLNTKGYTCLHGFSVIAEMFFDESKRRSWDAYVDCCEIIDARLKEEGIRDDIRFIGTSLQTHNSNPRYFKEEQATTAHIFDDLCVGNYNWDIETDIEECENYFEGYASVTYDEYDKGNLLISEFCQGKHFAQIDEAFNWTVNKQDIDDYTAALYHAQVMIAATSNGVTAMDHYILGNTKFANPFFADADPTIHSMGLWKWRDNGEFDRYGNYYIPEGSSDWVPWAAHPEYYVWALVCRYSDVGSTIYPVSQVVAKSKDRDKYVAAIAFKMPDNTWSYMILNKSNEEKAICITNENLNLPTSMKAYKVTEEGIPKNREVKVPTSYQTVGSGKETKIKLPAQSFVVLSNMA